MLNWQNYFGSKLRETYRALTQPTRRRVGRPCNTEVRGLLYHGLTSVQHLEQGSATLVHATEWQRRFTNHNSAQSGLRQAHPQFRLQVRTCLDKGGRKDLLVIRVA